MAHQGIWAGDQLVPRWWIDRATKSSQNLNPSYGYTFRVNTSGGQWPKARTMLSRSKATRRSGCYCRFAGRAQVTLIFRVSRKLISGFQLAAIHFGLILVDQRLAASPAQEELWS